MKSVRFQQYFARLSAALLFSVVMLAATRVRAQESTPRFEVGGQFSVIDMRDALAEKPGGVGGRFTYNLNEYAALDAELNYFSTGEVHLNRTQGLLGIKAGKRFGGAPLGLFVKARPGFMRFHGERRPGVTIDGTTKFALNLGGVVELYPSKRTVLRVDVGDTIIFYGDETVRRLSLPGGPQVQLGTSHGLQTSIGFGFRF